MTTGENDDKYVDNRGKLGENWVLFLETRELTKPNRKIRGKKGKKIANK